MINVNSLSNCISVYEYKPLFVCEIPFIKFQSNNTTAFLKADLLSSHDSPVFLFFLNHSVQVMSDDDMIPSNTTVRTDFMAQFLASLLRSSFLLTQTTSAKQ